jgi:eukaryotic-like serine/threonine-protein kinase
MHRSADAPPAVRPQPVRTDREERRIFLQQRLGVFGLWMFALSFGFYALNITSETILNAGFDWTAPVRPPYGLHLIAAALCGSLWLVARRPPLSLRALQSFDAFATIAVCTLYALMGPAFADRGFVGVRNSTVTAFALLSTVLGSSNMLIARAIALPSRAARTFWIGAAALAPMVGVAVWVGWYRVLPASVPLALVIVVWCAVALALSTVGSRIIFGLRREAALGKRLGQYTLDQKIGEGGMGVVYRAHHAILRRPTAIKLLRPEKAGEANIRRFEQEVQQTAQLSHPNTVAIYDYGRTPDGLFYYAMEFLAGINLQDLVTIYGAQPPGRVIHILQQTCLALAEAHELGLVHRDVKPANIILTERGGEPDVAKVVDFGLVKEIDTQGTSVTMTADNMLTGTPLYLPPETIRSDDRTDPRSDLYALGAVAYFLLTSMPVFRAQTVFEVCAHHLHSVPVPPSQVAPQHVPKDLEQVILECLAKSPEGRPQTARALHARLEVCRERRGWSRDEGAAWWKAHNDRRDRFSAGATTGAWTAVTQTVEVDVLKRVPHSNQTIDD